MQENTKTKKPRAKFYIERSSTWAQMAIIFMLLSAIFRLLGVWDFWEDRFFRITQIILPLGCNLFFALFLFIFCQRGFAMTSVPVIMGVAFFIIKALGFESLLHTVLCILLYLLVAVIYCGTAFGFIRTKWLLPPLFGLPFLYHIFVEDLGLIRMGAMSFSYAMQESSVLCVMLGLLCVGMGLKRKKTMEEANLPKIKDPVVVAPKAKEETATASTEADKAQDTVQESAQVAKPQTETAQTTESGLGQTETSKPGETK